MTRESNEKASSAKLEVYLSYSRASEANVPVINDLKKACAQNGVRLIFDVEELGLGDSIGRFMDELSQQCIQDNNRAPFLSGCNPNAKRCLIQSKSWPWLPLARDCGRQGCSVKGIVVRI